jgi:hypothetical protein
MKHISKHRGFVVKREVGKWRFLATDVHTTFNPTLSPSSPSHPNPINIPFLVGTKTGL